MDIDTGTIQRVRDALLQQGRAAPEAGDESADHGELPFRQDLLERFTPFAETMFLVAIVDGHEDPAELDALRGAMHMLTANQLPADALVDVYQRCKHDLAQIGLQQYLERIGSQLAGDRMDRETAFTLAAAVALADEQVHGAELELMSEIAGYFGISSKAAKTLLAEI
ncbi:TerB family tellurite resistance protein [Seongchinamella unica]|nr:TerB family tellurite resistance protein [Seongchinamella unica]